MRSNRKQHTNQDCCKTAADHMETQAKSQRHEHPRREHEGIDDACGHFCVKEPLRLVLFGAACWSAQTWNCPFTSSALSRSLPRAIKLSHRRMPRISNRNSASVKAGAKVAPETDDLLFPFIQDRTLVTHQKNACQRGDRKYSQQLRTESHPPRGSCYTPRWYAANRRSAPETTSAPAANHPPKRLVSTIGWLIDVMVGTQPRKIFGPYPRRSVYNRINPGRLRWEIPSEMARHFRRFREICFGTSVHVRSSRRLIPRNQRASCVDAARLLAELGERASGMS